MPFPYNTLRLIPAATFVSAVSHPPCNRRICNTHNNITSDTTTNNRQNIGAPTNPEPHAACRNPSAPWGISLCQWSLLWDSNPRPPAYWAGALPTKLKRQLSIGRWQYQNRYTKNGIIRMLRFHIIRVSTCELFTRILIAWDQTSSLKIQLELGIIANVGCWRIWALSHVSDLCCSHREWNPQHLFKWRCDHDLSSWHVLRSLSKPRFDMENFRCIEWLAEASDGRWVCNQESLHWGLSPGPSVYKTDALPLSYRGNCNEVPIDRNYPKTCVLSAPGDRHWQFGGTAQEEARKGRKGIRMSHGIKHINTSVIYRKKTTHCFSNKHQSNQDKYIAIPHMQESVWVGGCAGWVVERSRRAPFWIPLTPIKIKSIK